MKWHYRDQTFSASWACNTMDVLTVCGIQLSPVKNFDQLLEIRAQRHEYLRRRNNVTSCRSPTRYFNSLLIKRELKKKRHLEFLRRRSVSPDLSSLSVNYSSKSNPSTNTLSLINNGFLVRSENLHAITQNTTTANGRPVMSLTPNRITDGPSTSTWSSFWSEQGSPMRQEKGQAWTTASTSQSTQHQKKSTEETENRLKAQKKTIKAFTQTESVQQRYSIQTEDRVHKNMLQDTSVQTESGLVTIKESDVQRLSDYLQEALWREEALKTKLSALRESASKLTNSSELMWTARCNEDLLRNKIKALEAQLQVCLQSPKDGVKTMVLKMEKQKLVYEEKALVVVQKAIQERTEALIKAEAAQEGLTAAKVEALRWQNRYEELKLSNRQLKENQLLCNEQLQQLRRQVELSRDREIELREEGSSLRQEKVELQYNISLLEDDIQMLREEIEHLQDECSRSQDIMMQWHMAPEEEESPVTVKRESQVEQELRHTQEKLQHNERECQELQMELEAMALEFQSSRTRLSLCRDELRQLYHSQKRRALCDSWLKMFSFFLLLLVTLEVAMLWLWYPPFREHVEDLYSHIGTRIEDYLMEMSNPQHSGCFRPI
ncbi:TRAF3-interacting JNK-activating modulator [Antennarius striatus]|uniref:TRAF3-interacting JNK-activating modulator n=1 Tax=Antennarius striatus TaxID=241820 RepID=UPI0035B399D5